MRATGPSYAWPLVAGLIILTGCQQAAEPASAGLSDLGAAGSHPGKRRQPHQRIDRPAPEPIPAKTDDPQPVSDLADVSGGWNEPARKTVSTKSSTKTAAPVAAPLLQPTEERPSPAPLDPAHPTQPPQASARPDPAPAPGHQASDLSKPGEADEAKPSTAKSLRRTKTTPTSPTLDLGEIPASSPRARTGIALPDEIVGRGAPTGTKPDYDYAASTRVLTGSGEEKGAATDTGSTAPATDTPRRRGTSGKSAPSAIAIKTPDAADRPARPAPADVATLPAAGNGNPPGRTTRTSLPLRLSEWLADEKTHEEWRRRQQAKLAATGAERESERRRLKAALDQLIQDDVEPESDPAAPAAGK